MKRIEDIFEEIKKSKNIKTEEDIKDILHKSYMSYILDKESTEEANGSDKMLKWNVVDNEIFKDSVRKVFRQVADSLECTLGPYGSSTVIDYMGQLHVTKDGWSVLKRIYFDDRMHNNILNLLTNISAQVVLKVGDGSTSSIIAANNLLTELESDDTINKLRSKDLIDTLNKMVKEITNRIMEKSKKIHKGEDADYEEIYKLAKISTNGDEEIARIIQDIYVKTQNPSIGYSESKTNKTHYEVIDGYKANGITYLDTIFANDDDNNCNIDNPVILMFDHKIGLDHLKKIFEVVGQVQGKSRVVVIAPYYENVLLDVIRKQINAEYKATGTSNIVFCRTSMANNIFQEQFNDFCVMTGGTIIRETDADEWIDNNPEFNIKDHIGTVDSISIGTHHTLIKGFSNRNEILYQRVLKDAMSKYNEIKEKHVNMNIVNSELYELGQRISKLRGKVGFIHVGGNSSLEKSANKDLVEDAVKACESAYNFGYNIGGNLIIPIVIEEILDSKTAEQQLSEIEIDLYEKISNAFKNVFYSVLAKRGEIMHSQFMSFNAGSLGINGVTINEIINECIEKETCYDLIKEDYSEDIINSCFTDIEILKACISIITLILSSNQYITAFIPNN